MDGLLGQLVSLAAITSFAILFLFGQQFDGLIPSLRKHKKKPQIGKGVAIESDNATQTTLLMPATPSVPAPRPAPTQSTESEPRYIVFSRIIAERGQQKAAKWTLVLPQLLSHIATFPLLVGLFLIYCGIGVNVLISQPFGRANWFYIVGSILWALAMFLELIAWVFPIFMAHASAIAVLLRALKAS